MSAIEPRNERETIELFKITSANNRHKWTITHLQRKCPDAIIANDGGVSLRAEFEFKSRNFVAHCHDPNDCDLIICWEHNWKASPLPVWELSSSSFITAVDFALLCEVSMDRRNKELLSKISSLEIQLNAARSEIKSLKSRTGKSRLWLLCLIANTPRFCYASDPDAFEKQYNSFCEPLEGMSEFALMEELRRKCKNLKCRIKPRLCGLLSGLGLVE